MTIFEIALSCNMAKKLEYMKQRHHSCRLHKLNSFEDNNSVQVSLIDIFEKPCVSNNDHVTFTCKLTKKRC